MDTSNRTTQELLQGWWQQNDVYHCCACGAHFEEGQVYPIDNCFFTAAKAVERHLAQAHPHRLDDLLELNSKYNSLTETQRRLLSLFGQGLTDAQVAKELGISPSTVRHQKFTFREKAKAARLYLAQYQLAMQGANTAEAITPIHEHATMVDDRYVTTQKERDAILKAQFESLEPLRLRAFPPKEKKKVVILARIAEAFEPGHRYSEKQVNQILGAIFDDYATLRRSLITYGFMDRTKDGSEYWLK